ncbi:ABC transporter substrate-binding protein [Candidatus Nitrospira bockiana]
MSGAVLQRAAALFGWLLAVVFLALFPPASATAAEIAILKSSDIAAYNLAVSSLKAELGDAVFTEYDLQGDVARGRKLARKVRASDAALVVAVGLKAALAAKLEIVDVPVIYCMVLDPEKYDLRAPNLTGISLQVPVERQFTAMHQLLPKLKRVGVLYDPDKTGTVVEEARKTAGRLGFELVERQIRSEKDLPSALRGLLAKVDVLWLVPDSTVLTEESLRFVLNTTLDRNVPVVGFSSEFVRNGALAGLSISPEDIGRQAAVMAKKFLSASHNAFAAANTVPPDRIRLAVNLKTAKYLGLTVPQELVARADEVY